LQSVLSSSHIDFNLASYLLSDVCYVVMFRDLASLARAAVSGDESALDMFTWQKGKVNAKLSIASLGPQESVTFFIGGRNGRMCSESVAIIHFISL